MLSSALKRSAAQLQGFWKQPQLAAATARACSEVTDLQESYNRRVGHEDCPVSDLESHACYSAGYLHRTIREHGTMVPCSFWQGLAHCTIDTDGAYKVVRLPKGHHFFDSKALGSALLLTPGRQHILDLAEAFLEDSSRNSLTFAVCGAANTGKSFLLLEFMRQARLQGKAVLHHSPNGFTFYPAGPDVDYCWQLGNSFHAQTAPQDLWGGKDSCVVYITDGVDPRLREPVDALCFAALSSDAELLPISDSSSNVEMINSAPMTLEDLLKLREVEPLFQERRPLDVVRQSYDVVGADITSCLLGTEEREREDLTSVAPYEVIGANNPPSPTVKLAPADSAAFSAPPAAAKLR